MYLSSLTTIVPLFVFCQGVVLICDRSFHGNIYYFGKEYQIKYL